MKRFIKLITWRLLDESLYIKLQALYWTFRLKRNINYEREINFLHYFVISGSKVLDIGANCGQYTYYLSKLVGENGSVISFEPAKHAFEVLALVKKRLGLKNVYLHKIALGEKQGKLELETPLNEFGIPNIGLSRFAGNSNSLCEVVNLDTLDNFLIPKNIDLKNISFLKCDVEGFELFVLKGAKKLLIVGRPVLLLEIDGNHTRRAGYNAEQIFKFLEGLGYYSYVISDNALKFADKCSECFSNYFFIHKENVSKFPKRLTSE